MVDLGAINEIYNEAVLNTTATMDTEERSLADQRRWFDEHSGQLSILVCERNEEILGWASLSPWSDRRGYAETVEASATLVTMPPQGSLPMRRRPDTRTPPKATPTKKTMLLL